MIAACAAASGCRVPAGKMCRSVDLHRARLPRGESGSPFSERLPAGVFPRKLAQKKGRQSFVESVPYVQSEKAQVAPLRAFATPGDSAMLESCPFRLPANREAIRLKRCPMGSNAQVPANWAFLRILAQSHFFLPHDSELLGAIGPQGELFKMSIPIEERRTALKHLDLMNINAFSLFGSEDSLVRTVARREMLFRDRD